MAWQQVAIKSVPEHAEAMMIQFNDAYMSHQVLMC